MKDHASGNRRKVLGFTLIELLVVVAIIALLISILLPSLSKARGQARATLCASRISQLTKAFFMYANDFDETPPFIGIGFENLGDHESFEGKDTMDYWAEHEDWLLPTGSRGWVQTGAYQKPEADWDPYCKVENGRLFQYARFANLYRCPEFERIQNKEQNQFNFTRSVMGRKVLSSKIGDNTSETLGPGPIAKLSTIFAPAAMYMAADEQWDFHVAGNYFGQPEEGLLKGQISGYWMAADPIFAVIGDCIGDYHGAKGRAANFQGILEAKKGCVAFYDGHVDMLQDPLPHRVVKASGLDEILGMIQEAEKVLGFVLTQVYAQRGLPLQLADVVGML